MTQAVSVPVGRLNEIREVAPICAAHFLSHYYMIMLAPMFAFVRADYGVSYTDLALALTAFNVVSAVFQTPVGFLVDHIGARAVLITGIVLGAAAFAVAGLVHSFVVFIAMYAVAGLGNTVYHPADYSLLSRSPPARMGQIFSFHTFSGILGGAVAPATLLALQSHFGWRGAYVGAAILGAIVLIPVILQRPDATEHKRRRALLSDSTAGQGMEHGWRLLLSPPIMMNLLYFVLTSVMGGLNSFLIVALGALYHTPNTIANVALTALLLMNALGVLIGGVLAMRSSRHAAVAAFGLAFAGLATALIGVIGFSLFALVLTTSMSGLFIGITAPSRDMLVRAVTPLGAYGRVFGFVSSGFNIGAMIAPPIYGILMDHGVPRALFFFSGGCSILCIATVVFGFSRREQR